jgi:hypothetical protein
MLNYIYHLPRLIGVLLDLSTLTVVLVDFGLVTLLPRLAPHDPQAILNSIYVTIRVTGYTNVIYVIVMSWQVFSYCHHFSIVFGLPISNC